MSATNMRGFKVVELLSQMAVVFNIATSMTACVWAMERGERFPAVLCGLTVCLGIFALYLIS